MSSPVEATDIQSVSASGGFSDGADSHNHEACGETRPAAFGLIEEATLETEQADRSNDCLDTSLAETTNQIATPHDSELERSKLLSEVTAGSETPVKEPSTVVTSTTSKPKTTMSKTPGASPAKKVSS
jgi:hypothetical protein